jgi:hypothetical protein
LKTALLLLAILAAGCPSGLEEQSHISKLRVLGIHAEPAELVVDLDAGTFPSSDLTAMAVLPDGGSIAARFALCKVITPDPSPDLDCPGDAGIDLPSTGALTARLAFNDPRYLLFAESIDAGASLQASLDTGIPLIVGFIATAGAEKLQGFDSITLRSSKSGPSDVNPEILALQIGDGGAPQPINQVARLQPITSTKDDPKKQFLFSFFATGGSISSLHSIDIDSSGNPEDTWVDWTTPLTAETDTIWVVLRDGRGGTAWLSRSIPVR